MAKKTLSTKLSYATLAITIPTLLFLLFKNPPKKDPVIPPRPTTLPAKTKAPAPTPTQVNDIIPSASPSANYYLPKDLQ